MFVVKDIVAVMIKASLKFGISATGLEISSVVLALDRMAVPRTFF